MRPLVLAALVLIFAGGCASDRFSRSSWRQEIVLTTDTKLGGCALGDLLPGTPGDEIAVVSETGEIWVIRRENGTWYGEVVGTAPGEMIQCAVGDLVPEHPGDELVVVGAARGKEDDGGPGAAWILLHDGESWEMEPLAEDDALLHAVCIGDIDPGRPGDEVMIGGYSRRPAILSFVDGTWNIETTPALRGEAKGAAVAAGGVVVACADGSVDFLSRGDDGWTVEPLERFDSPQARVGGEGDRALVSDNSGALRLFSPGAVQQVYQSRDRLRGAVFLDIDPSREGLEMATAGYDGNVTVVYPLTEDGRAHLSADVGRDDDRLHHLAAGEIDGLGAVLVACGYSGRVLVVWSP